jgi:RHS repeat-associated protein
MLACTRRKSRADWVTTEYLRYGEDAPDAADHNLRGQVWRVFDQAGMVASEAHDYRGNLIESTRRLTQAYTGAVDWTALAEATTEEDRDDEADALLYAEVFTTTSTFDALGRPVETHPPRSSDGARATTHARAVRMEYNQGGLLARVEVQLGDDEAALDTYVDSITYNARRQRTGIVYGNGLETALTYDTESFRLTRLYTTREVATDTFVGQDLRYSYDAVGNITRMDDHAVMVDDEERMVHAGPQLMEPVVHAYTYDALDRLIAATGREHPGLLPTTTPLQPGSSGYDRGGPHPNDLAALEDYVEQYAYDAVGNFLTMQHAVPSETTHSWTRHYLYEGIGNRLTKTHGGNATGTGSYSYGYDEHGNMLAMPHLAEMDWNAYDELTRTDNGGGAGRVEHHFQYDASGQRVRKVVEHYTSGAATLIEERVYFGGFELYRRHQGAGTGLDKEVVRELQTLHVMDGEQRVALVDTRTVDMAPEDEDPTVLGVEARTTRVVYQLGNQLGSACLEVDADGEILRYEEFHPYGSSALLYAREGVDDAPKRYRFTGMECDDTGLQYHTARYYAPWLGRWTSTDPIGIADGQNVYAYCDGGVVSHIDHDGTQARDWLDIAGRSMSVLGRGMEWATRQLERAAAIPVVGAVPAAFSAGVRLTQAISGLDFQGGSMSRDRRVDAAVDGVTNALTAGASVYGMGSVARAPLGVFSRTVTSTVMSSLRQLSLDGIRTAVVNTTANLRQAGVRSVLRGVVSGQAFRQTMRVGGVAALAVGLSSAGAQYAANGRVDVPRTAGHAAHAFVAVSAQFGGSREFSDSVLNLRNIRSRISEQAQNRHILGHRLHVRVGALQDQAQAQRVLDAFRSRRGEFLWYHSEKMPVIRIRGEEGFSISPPRYPMQPTSVFWIKGSTGQVSVVPISPTWKSRR